MADPDSIPRSPYGFPSPIGVNTNCRDSSKPRAHSSMNQNLKTNYEDWINSTIGKVFAFYAANLGSVPGIPYSPWGCQ